MYGPCDDKNVSAIKVELRRASHYIYGSQNHSLTTAGKFLESLKSENSTRREEISKWVHRNLTKLTHKIEKEYQELIESLKQQKEAQLAQLNSKFEEFTNTLNTLPNSRNLDIELLEKDMRVL